MPTFIKRDWKSIISSISAYVVQDMLLHGCNFNSMRMPLQAIVKFCIILPRMLCVLTENWEFITSASHPAIQRIFYRNKTLHIDMAGLTWLFVSFLQVRYLRFVQFLHVICFCGFLKHGYACTVLYKSSCQFSFDSSGLGAFAFKSLNVKNSFYC